MSTLISVILEASQQVDVYDSKRTRYSVLADATSGLGQLAGEVAIVEGNSFKEASEDGLVGQAVDTILAIVDLIYKHQPNITEDDLVALALQKGSTRINDLIQHQVDSLLPVSTITQSGLGIYDITVGTGLPVGNLQHVSINYTGWLQNPDTSAGLQFDSTLDRGDPFEFKTGVGMVIAGMDEGVIGMRVGGKRKLVIPPHLGYGTRGAGSVIPANAVLIFEVELMST